MGMLRNGRWTEEDEVVVAGAYERQPSVFNQAITPELIEAMSREPDRFHLIASQSCPWSHRTMLVRALKDLGAAIPMHIAHGPRVQGYSANGGTHWPVPGTDESILHLHQLYTLSDVAYSGRSTVPILWDSQRRRIVSNDSAAIMRAFDAVPSARGHHDFTLLPEQLLPEIDAINAEIYTGLSNGVYRAVFAEKQEAYDSAVRQVFDTMGKLDRLLSDRRYLLGSTITEADWRGFPTLMRFDAVYYIQHLCSHRRLVDYPNLWAYARDLYSWQGVAETLDLEAMRAASYATEAHGIVPIAPHADWSAPHEREALGPAHLALRSGQAIEVEPTTLGHRQG